MEDKNGETTNHKPQTSPVHSANLKKPPACNGGHLNNQELKTYLLLIFFVAFIRSAVFF
ncbi:hypothetical protein GGU45_001919 [Niabella hirudinis]